MPSEVIYDTIFLMKCVILAAGAGKRMRPLTLYHPKPMLQVIGKPILEHLLESLPPAIDEVIMVVGYLGDQIRSYFGEHFGRFKVSYVTQDRPLGTYHALLLTRPLLDEGRFLVMIGDDLHGRSAIHKAVFQPTPSLLVAEVPDPREFGVVTLGPDGKIMEIEEKPAAPKSNFVSTGVMVLDHRVFNYQPARHANGEYYLPTAVNQMLRDHSVSAIFSTAWQQVGYPEDLDKATAFLKRNEHLN